MVKMRRKKMGWTSWFEVKKEEECPECDELGMAIRANKAASKEAIAIQQRSRQQSRNLIKLGEDALKVLEKSQGADKE